MNISNKVQQWTGAEDYNCKYNKKLVNAFLVIISLYSILSGIIFINFDFIYSCSIDDKCKSGFVFLIMVFSFLLIIGSIFGALITGPIEGFYDNIESYKDALYIFILVNIKLVILLSVICSFTLFMNNGLLLFVYTTMVFPLAYSVLFCIIIPSLVWIAKQIFKM